MGMRTRRLRRAAHSGRPLDLCQDDGSRGAVPRLVEWLRTVSAEDIRALLLTSGDSTADPRGITLCGARITGTLDLSDVRASIPLNLQHCRFDEPVVADRAHLPSLSLAHSTLPRFRASQAWFEHTLDLDFVTISTDGKVAVCLDEAYIGGDLTVRHATLTSSSEAVALQAGGLHVSQDASLEDLRASCHGGDGAVRMPNARIDGYLTLSGARLDNDGGPALQLDSLSVGGNLILSKVIAKGSSKDHGALWLTGAQVAGQLQFDEAQVECSEGPAVMADGARIDSDALLYKLRATGHDSRGAVRLHSVHVGGQLNLDKAVLCNGRGPALAAVEAQIAEDAYLRGLDATGRRSPDGDEDELLDVLVLRHARIGGELQLDGKLANDDGGRVAIDLRDCHVAGTLCLWNETFWRPTATGSRAPSLRLEGFVYRTVPAGLEPETWLKTLDERMPKYHPQPYRQLAEVLREAGEEVAAKKTLMVQQGAHGTALRKERGRLSWAAWLWNRISGITVGYGYRPGRALFFLLGVLVVSAILMVVAADQGLLNHVQPYGTGHCGWVDAIGVAADRTVPLVGLATAPRCVLSDAPAAEWLFVTNMALQALGWAFLTLFIAGFTGVVRKGP
uniref:Membrane-associated oxidoreductase n=1 Tax=Kitasatospora sp. CMC57 TaxID=3231513 RepID=A0AB33K425_9ACTN